MVGRLTRNKIKDEILITPGSLTAPPSPFKEAGSSKPVPSFFMGKLALKLREERNNSLQDQPGSAGKLTQLFDAVRRTSPWLFVRKKPQVDPGKTLRQRGLRLTLHGNLGKKHITDMKP